MTPEHARLIERLGTSAAALAAAVASVPPGTESQTPGPGEWSVRETLIHARNVALLVNGLRLRRLIYESEPVFADFDEARFRRAHLARAEPIADLVAMIIAEHQQIARLLRALPDDEWQRSGRHPERGPMSIEVLARWSSDHAEEHAAQIAATAKRI
jgi:hypothetical protein